MWHIPTSGKRKQLFQHGRARVARNDSRPTMSWRRIVVEALEERRMLAVEPFLLKDINLQPESGVAPEEVVTDGDVMYFAPDVLGAGGANSGGATEPRRGPSWSRISYLGPTRRTL